MDPKYLSVAAISSLVLSCAASPPIYSLGECMPQVEPWDGSAKVRVRVEPTGAVSEVELLEATQQDGFGALAVHRERNTIYPIRKEPTEEVSTTNFRNIQPADRIFIAEPVSLSETKFTDEDYRAALDEDLILWACGRFESRVRVDRVLCAESIEPEFTVHGSLGHSSCMASISTGRSFLIWTRLHEGNWWVEGAYPVYETGSGDLAINMWAAEDLLLDRLEREIHGLPDASPAYFEVSNEFEASRENLNLYDESPRYVVRGSAVYPRTGVLIREATSALRSGGR